MVLVGEPDDAHSDLFGPFGKRGELGMRGEVLLTGISQRVVTTAVLAIGGERPLRPLR